MKSSLKIWGLAAVLAVQFAALGWIIARYERVVLGGVECRFACQAYDPYDPFRGRFLRMQVREDCPLVPGFEPDHWKFEAFVQIDPVGETNGLAKVVECAPQPGAEGLWVRMDRLYKSGSMAQVNFPNQFFMNERLAPAAERILRERMTSAVAVYRVTPSGMVLTDIEIDGTPIAELAKKAGANKGSAQ